MIPLALLLNRYTLAAAAVAVVAAGAFWYRGELIQTGYDTAMAEVQIAQADRLREQINETSRLVGVVKGLQDDAQKQRASIDGFRDRERVAAQRLRDQEIEHSRRLAAASSEALRRYAASIDGNLERCRADVERFAAEAARGSIAAHALKNYVEALP